MLLLKMPIYSFQCAELENKGINLRYSEGVGTEQLSCIRAHLIFRTYEHFITFSFPLEVIIFALPWAFVLTYTNSVGETAFNKNLQPAHLLLLLLQTHWSPAGGSCPAATQTKRAKRWQNIHHLLIFIWIWNEENMEEESDRDSALPVSEGV